jgi:hypothetical protein
MREVMASLPAPQPIADPFLSMRDTFKGGAADPRSARNTPGSSRLTMPSSPKSGLPSPDQVRRMDAAALEALLADLVSADDLSLDLIDAETATPRARAIAAAGRTVADKVYDGVVKRQRALGIDEDDASDDDDTQED